MLEDSKQVYLRCFYNSNHLINVRRSIFENNGEGFLKQEFKGRALPDGPDKGVYVGAIGVFCNEECHDAFCGPRPKRTLEDDLDELEEKLKDK